MWHEITRQSDVEDFMEIFGGFHDSCIKEFKYLSGAYVDERLYMYPVNDRRVIRMIVQRQSRNPSVVEMEFEGLTQLNLYPSWGEYSCEILDATIILGDDSICWYDSDAVISDFSNYEGTLLCADKLRWRTADEYIGTKEVYIAICDDEKAP